ncbi:MAG: hypothetical protein U1E76_21250 [Planctomycetota bacterium]
MDPLPLDLTRLKTYSLGERKNLVTAAAFARALEPSASFAEFFDSLPDILGAKGLKRLVQALADAQRDKRVIIWGLGGHVIKVGLGPLIIDMMQRGLVSAVAMNGAAAIHDAEIGLLGATSEDVGEGIKDGSFGMARETAQWLNGAAREAHQRGEGFGQSLARRLVHDGANRTTSILAASLAHRCPVTVHVAIGQDIVHMHASADGAAIGAATMCDFQRLAGVVAQLDRGVYLNVGSAVALPEVFLKALALARNLGHQVSGFTTCNIDQLPHYRPRVNVLERPGGVGLDLRGHHEILVPLIRMAVLSRMSR